eukprot:3624858-Lingulodinium_polyedra.AAC.1
MASVPAASSAGPGDISPELPHEGYMSLCSDGTSQWIAHSLTGEKSWLPSLPSGQEWSLHLANNMAFVARPSCSRW